MKQNKKKYAYGANVNNSVKKKIVYIPLLQKKCLQRPDNKFSELFHRQYLFISLQSDSALSVWTFECKDPSLSLSCRTSLWFIDLKLLPSVLGGGITKYFFTYVIISEK